MTEDKAAQQKKAVLVVGGGISGLTVAVETAEAGWPVVLVERGPSLGGRVAANHLYFPKMCPPPCGLEINYQRLRKNPGIRIYTHAEVTKLADGPGGGTATIAVAPRYVNEKCTCCGKCAEACTMEVDSPFNYQMNKVKAAHLPHSNAFPARYILHPSLVSSAEADKVKQAREMATMPPAS